MCYNGKKRENEADNRIFKAKGVYVMLLIRQAAVYAPEYLGIKDVLICSNKIEAIEDHIDGEIPFCKVVDGHGKKLTPGFLDPHIHITGGG